MTCRMLAIATVCFQAATVCAWDDQGHMAAALLACRNGDVDTAAIVKILEQNPDIAAFVSAGAPGQGAPGLSVAQYKIARAATWPDFVRPLRAGLPDAAHQKLSAKYFKPTWHYINLPYVKPGENVQPLAPLPENVVAKLDEMYKDVLAAETKPEDRANALCWVLHLVGDIHQPLHAVALFSAQYPKGDKGGNAEVVRPVRNGQPRAPIVLHAYWDDLPGTSRDPAQAAAYATSLADDPALAAGQFPQFNKEAPTAFMDWAKESAKLAETDAYLKGELKTADAKGYQEKQISVEDVPVLSGAYEEQAQKDARRQLALAGLRLGVLLGKVR